MSNFSPGQHRKNTIGNTHKHSIGMVLFTLIVLGPVLALIIQTGETIATGNLNWLGLAIPKGRQWSLFLRSLGLSFGVALFSVFIGGLVASFLWGWCTKLGQFMRWFLLVLAPLPPYIHALAWSAIFMQINIFLRQQGLSEIVFRGWIASWWVQSMAVLPVTIGLGLVGFKMIDPNRSQHCQTFR